MRKVREVVFKNESGLQCSCKRQGCLIEPNERHIQLLRQPFNQYFKKACWRKVLAGKNSSPVKVWLGVDVPHDVKMQIFENIPRNNHRNSWICDNLGTYMKMLDDSMENRGEK